MLKFQARMVVGRVDSAIGMCCQVVQGRRDGLAYAILEENWKVYKELAHRRKSKASISRTSNGVCMGFASHKAV